MSVILKSLLPCHGRWDGEPVPLWSEGESPWKTGLPQELSPAVPSPPPSQKVEGDAGTQFLYTKEKLSGPLHLQSCQLGPLLRPHPSSAPPPPSQVSFPPFPSCFLINVLCLTSISALQPESQQGSARQVPRASLHLVTACLAC